MMFTAAEANKRMIEDKKIAGSTFVSQKWDKAEKRYSYTKFWSGFIGFISGYSGAVIVTDIIDQSLVAANPPPFILLVLVDEPQGSHYGGTTALPTFKRIIKRVLESRDDLLKNPVSF